MDLHELLRPDAASDCWATAVATFRKVAASSDSCYFVSLMVPKTATRSSGEHFVVELGGLILDPTLQRLEKRCSPLSFDEYQQELHVLAEALGVLDYECLPLRFDRQQFTLFLDIVSMSCFRNQHPALSKIRECAELVLAQWGNKISDVALAQSVLSRVTGEPIILQERDGAETLSRADPRVGCRNQKYAR